MRLFCCVAVAATALLSLPNASAQSISVDVQRSGGVPQLNASGDWVWEVTYNTDADGGSAAIELGFTFADADLLAGSVSLTGIGNGGVEVANPAPPVFGWETLGTFGFPEGIQVDPLQGTNGEVFWSAGTGVLLPSTSLLLSQFTTVGPTLAAATSSIDVVGAYDSSGDLVGTLPGTHGAVFDGGQIFPVTTSGSITAGVGDIDLDGFVGDDDVSVLTTTFGGAVTNGWAGGDLDGSGAVSFDDVYAFSPAYQGAAPATTAGSSGDGQVSYQYNPLTGEVTLDPDGNDVGLLRLVSASDAFTGAAATLPTGSFAEDTDGLVGTVINTGSGAVVDAPVSLGAILPAGLDESFLLSDLTLNWSGGFGTANQDADLAIDSPVSAGPGDFNGDGAVDNFDLNLLLINWGASVPPVPEGWTGFQPIGGSIDNDELNPLLLNWGVGAGTSIPEPATLALACLPLAMLRRR